MTGGALPTLDSLAGSARYSFPPRVARLVDGATLRLPVNVLVGRQARLDSQPERRHQVIMRATDRHPSGRWRTYTDARQSHGIRRDQAEG